MAKNSTTAKKGTIKDVDCILRTTASGKGLLVEWNDNVYITNTDFLSQLIDGSLKTKKGKKAKSVRLGLLTEHGIEQTEPQLFLTLKGKSIYFSPEENVLLVVPVSNVASVISGESSKTNMGEFVD